MLHPSRPGFGCGQSPLRLHGFAQK